MKRRTIISALVLVAVLLMADGLRGLFPQTPKSTKVASIEAPVLSPRRVPNFMAASANDVSTRSTISQLINNSSISSASGRLCVAIRQNGREVVDLSTTAPMIPASTLKILTASTALNVLGGQTRFTTAVKTNDEAKKGVVSGPLYLVGGGDPLLFTNDYARAVDNQPDVHSSLEALADAVVKAGIKDVEGGVVGDDSRFDNVRYLPSWDPSYVNQGVVGPTTALLVNQGFSRFTGGKVVSTDPTRSAAAAFQTLLEERGVDFTNAASVGAAPTKGKTVASVDSPTVAEAVREMLVESDNTTAEMLLKQIGMKSKSEGSTRAGTIAVQEDAQAHELPIDNLTLRDGSGLDRGNRATCQTLVDELGRDGSDGVIASSLPRAGESGTLKDRMLGTPAVGLVQAKTGSLFNVSALVGWVRPVGTSPISFAVINNGVDTDQARRFEDRLAVALTDVSTSVSPGAYAPGSVGP